MNWDTMIYSFLLILVALSAIVFYAENYIYTGLDDSGNPILFSFGNYQQADGFSQENMESLHEQTDPEFDSVIQDGAPDNIWALAAAGFNAFNTFLNRLFFIPMGYQRFIAALFTPLNFTSGCAIAPTQAGCVGTGLANIINAILLIPLTIGVIYFIKLILQTVGISK